MRVYIVLISMLLANLAWLVNPHACCPMTDDATYCSDMGCSKITCAINSTNIPESCCSYKNMKSNYLQITQLDQFSKGINNYLADTTSASFLSNRERPSTVFIFKGEIMPGTEHSSSVVLPIEKPPDAV